MVDVFRRPELVPAIVDDAIASRGRHLVAAARCRSTRRRRRARVQLASRSLWIDVLRSSTDDSFRLAERRMRKPLHTWERLASEIAYACRIFSIRRDRARFSRDEAEHDFHVLESTDWVNIIPITPSGEVVLVRQFRHGIRDCTLEIPGGMVDPEDPSPLVAARREMIEESGYDSERVEALWDPFIPIPPSRTITAIRSSPTTSSDGMRRHFDSTEETEVVLVPLARIPDLIRAGDITHALVVVAFHWLLLRQEV